MRLTNRQLLHAFPWEKTALGAMEQWSDEMRGVVSAALNSAFPICTAWGDEHLQVYNDAYNPIFGAKHPDSFGAPVHESWPEIAEFLQPALQQVRSTQQPLWFQGTLLPLARSGAPEECYFDFSYSPVVSKDGRVLGVLSAAVERTAEVVARRRKPVESWSFQFTGQQDTIGMIARALAQRIEGNVMDGWHAAIHPLDSATGGLLATPMWQLRPGERIAAFMQYPAQAPTEVLRLDIAEQGEHASYAHLVPLKDAHGRPTGAISLVPNALVTEPSHREFCQLLHDRLHAALREAEARRSEFLLLQKDFKERERLYAFLFENMQDAAVYTATGPGPGDTEVILAANQKACELTGYSIEELVGKQREALFFRDDKDLQDAVRARSASSAFVGELQLRRKDGSAVPVEISARLVEIGAGKYRSVCIVRDVSWRRAREKALADRARFDAMVELTGGIAHDFNNFLTIILGSLDALEDGIAEGSPARQLVANAILGAERAASLTEQLLTYAKRSTLHSEPIRWKPFLDEIEGLLASTVGQTSVLKIDVEPDLPVCDLDAAQLTSALLNLAANARDAMPGGGALTVRVRRERLKQPSAGGKDNYELPAGDYVEVCVSDTGVGIKADTIRRIFEPFFTTKDSASGSGLGLAMVQGFVRQSGGDIRVRSCEGQGTQFQILLPAGSTASAPDTGTRWSAAGEIVLLVEDNEAVRRQTMAMLRSSGMRVLEAHDGESAFHQLRANPRVDVLLANVTLPGALSGVELAQAAREHCPHLAVVLTTGGVRAPLLDRVQAAGFRVVRKPFTARELAQAALAEVHGRSQPAARTGS